VKLQVINDSTCGNPCKPDEVLVGLKQALPTLLTQNVDANSDAGKKLIATFGIKTLPAFVFSKEITQTDLFTKAQPFLQQQGDSYAINSAQAGFPVGKYISAPTISTTDMKIGSDDAKVKVVAFSDFANPADAAAFQTIVTPMIKDYGDKIQFIFDNYFAPGSTVSTTAALAAECANAQGKLSDYANKLFTSQGAWAKLKDPTTTLEGFAAQLGMKSADFNQCLSSKQFQPQVDASTALGQSFGLQGTPSIFIGSDLQAQGVKYDDVKKALDTQLGN
jgi:protein-disulfide isomerase